MAGSVFLIALVVVVFVVAILLWGVVTAIPVAVGVLVVGFGIPFVLGLLRRAPGGGGEVPTTGEASYDPTPDPSER